MSWVKLDDQARQHRKLLAVGPTASWLWVCGLMYCNSQKARDGFIPTEAVAVLYPIPTWKKEVTRLVSAGLWEPVDGGYVVHDYHDYQPTAEKALETSEAKAAAGRLGGLRSGATRRSKAEANGEAQSKRRASNDEADAKQGASLLPKPVPSRPVPVHGDPQISLSGDLTPEAHEARTKQTRRKAKSPFPDDFAVSVEIERMCRSERLPNPHEVLPDFRSKALANDYRYADWEAAFRSWMRSAITRRDYPAWDPPEAPAPEAAPTRPATPEEIREILATAPKPKDPTDPFAKMLAAAGAADAGAPVFWTPKAAEGGAR